MKDAHEQGRGIKVKEEHSTVGKRRELGRTTAQKERVSKLDETNKKEKGLCVKKKLKPKKTQRKGGKQNWWGGKEVGQTAKNELG